MGTSIVWDPANDQQMIGAGIAALLLPQAHPNLGDHLADVRVADCQTGANSPLDEALFRLLAGRVTGTPYACHP